jgi:hypothetical protein
MSTSDLPSVQHTAYLTRVPEAGHYPESQPPDVTTEAILRFLKTVD